MPLPRTAACPPGVAGRVVVSMSSASWSSLCMVPGSLRRETERVPGSLCSRIRARRGRLFRRFGSSLEAGGLMHSRSAQDYFTEPTQRHGAEVVAAFRRALQERGLFGALGYLNSTTEYRFTGIYHFELDWVRSVLLFD